MLLTPKMNFYHYEKDSEESEEFTDENEDESEDGSADECECEIWIFAKSHTKLIKGRLENILEVDCKVVAVEDAADSLGEALISKRDKLKHLTRQDHIIIVGGLNGRHLDENQLNINHFCSSVRNVNITLYDKKFTSNLKSIEQRYRHVRCVFYNNLDNVFDHVCGLFKNKTQDAPKYAKTKFDLSHRPSTSFNSKNRNMNAACGSSRDIFRGKTSQAFGRNTASNAFRDPRYYPSLSISTNLKERKETGAYPKNNARSKSRPGKVLNVAHQNINGLYRKVDNLLKKINELSRMNTNLDVICLTEHNMIEADVDRISTRIPNYDFAHTVTRDERRGGATILVRDDLEVQSLPGFKVNSDPDIIECCATRIVKYNIIIVCVYRPPRENRANVNEFFEGLKDMFHLFKNKKLIICGDFNIDIKKQHSISRDFQKLIEDYSMTFAIEEGTRPASDACIDNIIHNVSGAEGENVDWDLSDHFAQLLTCPL